MHKPHALVRVLALAAATLCAQAPAQAAIVINEVDYDQAGTDSREFIELYNNGATPVSLAGLSLRLVNGASNSQYGQIDLPATVLAPGAFYVICGAGGGVANCNLPGLSATDGLQNGSPDAIALVDNAGAVVLSALSYEGAIFAASLTGFAGTANLVSGTPLAAGTADSNSVPDLGLSRLPNGVASGDDARDWSLSFITPGSANGIAPVPEPASLALWLCGLAGLAAQARRIRPTSKPRSADPCEK